MICSDCGAEYNETDLQCPYCGRENEKAAEKMKQEKLRMLEQEAEQIRTLPKKKLNESTKRLVKISMVVAGVVAALILISVVASHIQSLVKYHADTEKMDTLQEYYDERDYEGLMNYVNEKNIYESKFEKYAEVGNIYEEYLWDEGQIDEYHKMQGQQFWKEKNIEERKNLGFDTIFYLTKGLARACVSCKEQISTYGEFDDVEPYEQLEMMCRELLEKELLYTGQEIEELYGLIEEGAKEEEFRTYIEHAFMRLEERYDEM